MKCQECISEAKKSQVRIGASTSTLMGYQPYYDEDGVFHSHDSNWNVTSYSCSRGHRWNERYKDKCPAPNCKWNRQLQEMGQ